MKPWTVETVATPEAELQLRQRGDDALITIAGRVLMTSIWSDRVYLDVSLRPSHGSRGMTHLNPMLVSGIHTNKRLDP